MNFTYFRFLFATTIKKRPVWITLLLMLLTCSIFILILPAVARLNTLQVWANTTMAACESFLGMTIALFSAVLAIHIFKDGIVEGTELIVISKPIKRRKIILTKYLVFGTFCLLANLLVLVLTAFTVFLPSTETKFYWGLIVSMFIGNSVTFLFFGAIAIILTIKMAKTGVIVINVLISLVLIIYQMLTLLVFEVPARSLVNHGVLTPTYIVVDRDRKDGSYKETEVVKFGITDVNVALDPQHQFNGSTWQEVEKYWKDEILATDPTLVLNITDVAGQLALSYLTVGIDGYSHRQASRQLALSRYYKYQLSSPASPEIIGGVTNKKTLPWVYVKTRDEVVYDWDEATKQYIEYTYSVPESFGFIGISPTSANRLKGFGDQIPIGVYAPAGRLLTATDVMFEKDQYNTFAPYFDEIYKHIFDQQYYDTATITDPYMLPSAWADNNANLKRYYKLIWSIFTGNSKNPEYFDETKHPDLPFYEWDNTTFRISSVKDLNERFIQFKYYTFYKALDEQQKILVEGPSTTLEQTAYDNAQSQLTKTYKALNVKRKEDTLHPKNFLLVQDDPAETYSLAEENIQAPDITLIKKTYDRYKETSGVTTEQLAKSAYATYTKTSTIYRNCCDQDEDYLFTSLNSDERSAQQTGSMYCVKDDWYSNLDFELIAGKVVARNHNMKYFYYTTTPRIAYWVYAAIWTTISMSVLAASYILYTKYDFH